MSSPNLTSTSTSTSTSTGTSDVDTIELAGIKVSRTNAIILSAGGGANAYDGFRSNGAYYQVPVGYKLNILAIRTMQALTYNLYYADASVNNNAAPPAGNTLLAMGSAAVNGVGPAVAGGEYLISDLSVAAGKYLHAFSTANWQCFILCELEAV